MSTRIKDIIVIALSDDDFNLWLIENDELSTASVVGVIATSWEDVAPTRIGIYANTYILTERAANDGRIGGVETPRWLRVADKFAEKRRPAYLGVAA